MTILPPTGDDASPEPSKDPALWPAPATANPSAAALARPAEGAANPFEESAAPPPPPPSGRDLWRPWTAWVALLTGFGFTIVGGLVVAIVATAMGASAADPSTGVTLGLTFFQDSAFVAAALLFAHLAGRPWPKDFGLRTPLAGKDQPQARRTSASETAAAMIAVMVGFYVFSAIWVSALGLDERQSLPDELGVGGSTVNLLLVVLLITIVAPLAEEILFRGYIFGALRNWHGWLPAAIITGLIFGAIHIGSAPIGLTVPLAAFGFGLCWLYQRTGSLYPCIGLHALNNSVALGLTQHWTWQILPAMLVAVSASLFIASRLARTLEGRAAAVVPPFAQPAS